MAYFLQSYTEGIFGRTHFYYVLVGRVILEEAIDVLVKCCPAGSFFIGLRELSFLTDWKVAFWLHVLTWSVFCDFNALSVAWRGSLVFSRMG